MLYQLTMENINSPQNNSPAQKRVLTAGVFDLLHIGHIKLFMNARTLGDYLIVAVQDSEYVNIYKPGTDLFYSQEEREFLVGSIRFVDKTVIYSSVDRLVKEVDFDIFAIGPDQNNEAFSKAIEWCEKNGKEVRIVPRTEGISSSQLRDNIK